MSKLAAMTVEHAGPEKLPAGCDALFESGARQSFFLSRPWFRLVLAHGMAPREVARFLVARENGEATALFAMKTSKSGIGFRSAAGGLIVPYTCLFAPLLAPGEGAHNLTGAMRRWPVVRLDALDPAAPSTSALMAAARATGWSVRPFDHFGNWHEPVAGLSWQNYVAARPGVLRTTVRRKLGRMARDGGALEVIADVHGLEAGIAAYEAVYARSWKQPEPFPDFNAALMRALAPLGKLRLGIYRIGGEPVAAQIWLVEHGRGSVLKLAHDDRFRDASPGTVLTALMLCRLIDEEHVQEIDFGRGDDDYKKLWASQRRQRIGLLLLNPRHPIGLAALLRHDAGTLRHRLRFGRHVS